jgi:ABC-type multidrug transport system fused ATPase/permease subunit
LYEVLIDPQLGACMPALPGDGDAGLLLDPLATTAKEAIAKAWMAASNDEATLVLALVGHGDFADGKFFFLPSNAQTEPFDPLTVVNLMQLLAELQAGHSAVDGFVVLIDACSSGEAAVAAPKLLLGDAKYDLRYEILTAASDRPAADGCFTKTLVALIRDGLPQAAADSLRLEGLRSAIDRRCRHQKSQHTTWNPDPGLFLARNISPSRSVAPLARSATMGAIEELTQWLEPTEQLKRVVSRAQEVRILAVVGEAGSGKSTLAAALARPEVSANIVPDGFVQAAAFFCVAAR